MLRCASVNENGPRLVNPLVEWLSISVTTLVKELKDGPARSGRFPSPFSLGTDRTSHYRDKTTGNGEGVRDG